MATNGAPPNLPGSSLVDQYGRSPWGSAYDPPEDPLAKVNPDRTARVIYRDMPIVSATNGSWSLRGIRRTLDVHCEGNFYESAMLTEAIEPDDRLQAALNSRCVSLFSQPMRHKAASDTRNAKRVKGSWKEAWTELSSQDALIQIMRCVRMMGFALAQICWDTTVTPWQPYLRFWPAQAIYYITAWRKYIVMTVDGIEVVQPGNGKWFLYAPNGQYRGWLQGSVRTLAEKWFIKSLAWRDWARFNERHGLPIIKAYVPAAGDLLQKQAFVQGMHTLGQEAVIGLPQNVDTTGYNVELLEARDRAYGSFMDTIKMVDRATVLAIQGQNLTTEVEEGSLAAARVHGSVKQTYVQFDATTLENAVYKQISRPFAFFNYGDPNLATRSGWKVEPFEDYLTQAQTFFAAAQGVQQLRLSGITLKNPQKLFAKMGLQLGKTAVQDPTQVAAKLAGATDSDPEDDSAKKKVDAKETARIWKQFRAFQKTVSE